MARRLCATCRAPVDLPKSVLKEQGVDIDSNPDVIIYEAHHEGCEYCKNGYSGRIGLYEVLCVTSEIEKVILTGGTSRELLDVALKEGMLTLRASGLQKVNEGITSLEEINRVTTD